MDVLHLFNPDRHQWTVQAMAVALHSPPSTVYRHVAELVQADLLEAGVEASYRLGPSFVEFDRLVRITDPLTRFGEPLVQRLVAEAGVPCIGLVARLYKTMVMCVADAAAPDTGFRSAYQRGRPMPLAQGAASKAILSQLPPSRLAAFLRQADEGPDIQASPAFREDLAEIRRRGIATSRGEVTPGVDGFAAPVVSSQLGLVASVSLVMQATSIDRAQERRHVAAVVMAANTLAAQLNAGEEASRPT